MVPFILKYNCDIRCKLIKIYPIQFIPIQPIFYIRQMRCKQAESLIAIAQGNALGFEASSTSSLIIDGDATNNERGESFYNFPGALPQAIAYRPLALKTATI
ncbi:hypothetical protein [Marinilabilia salmonicolor]|jgi:hypothetical protein|nr:hypothetical protein [Marinilabilia salmonicolor]